MRLIYTLLFYLAIPFLLLRLLWRSGKAPAYRRRWAERFGFFAAIPQTGCIWVHAVSIGETRAALPLIRALQERYRNTPLLITTMTPTGSQQVREALGDSVYHVYLPYDLPDAMRRFLLRSKPRLAIIMETEAWPNLLHACQQAAIPVLLANARLSERSALGYARFASFSKQTLNKFTIIAAQTRADANRFYELGFNNKRLRITGNIKYDLSLPMGLAAQGGQLRQQLFSQRRVWIAASTHQGEDEQLLACYKVLQQQFPDLLLVLVPRHPERFTAVAELCDEQGLHYVKRSSQRPCTALAQVFIGDSMGELLLFYATADVAFVGGSLIEHGGHNILEPALLGIPVLFGPHMFNFTEASEHLLRHEAAYQVADRAELQQQLSQLLADKSLRQRIGKRSQKAVEANRGALGKLFDIVEALIDSEQIQLNQRLDQITYLGRTSSKQRNSQ